MDYQTVSIIANFHKCIEACTACESLCIHHILYNAILSFEQRDLKMVTYLINIRLAVYSDE